MGEIENLKIDGGATYTVGNEDIIANEWEASKTYVKGKSYVTYEHGLYVCNTTHTSVEPFDPTKWTATTIGEALGSGTITNDNNLPHYTGTPTQGTTAEAVNTLNLALGQLPSEIRCGIGNYSGLKGGGHANRVTVPITFSTAMTGTQYAVFIVVSDAYSDYPYVQGYCFGGSRTVNGFTATILSMSSDAVTEINGSFYWIAVRYI